MQDVRSVVGYANPALEVRPGLSRVRCTIGLRVVEHRRICSVSLRPWPDPSWMPRRKQTIDNDLPTPVCPKDGCTLCEWGHAYLQSANTSSHTERFRDARYQRLCSFRLPCIR